MAENSATFVGGGAGGKMEVNNSIVNIMSGNYGTASGAIGARPKRMEEESPSTSGATGTTREDYFQLSESIWCSKERRLAKNTKVFEGLEDHEITGIRLLAIKTIWQYTKINRREAKNLSKLNPHTHVVGIVRTGVWKGMPGVNCLYIAMERCSTLNLEDYIKERRSKNVPFNPNTAFEHAKQVIDAIDHIHGYNILHRDLKPSSVLFSPRGVLKICDFGMSKELENGHTVTRSSTLKIDKDGYRAPETYNENVISKMTDIFSLALVLYHLLSYGYHPFGIDPDNWIFNIKKYKELDLSRLRDPFLRIVMTLYENMLKFEPQDRLKIDQVRNSEFMKLDWVSSITESLVPIWNGTVKEHVGEDMLPCQLYISPSLQDVIEIDESGWKFQMNTVSYLDIGSLKKVADEEPSGYIVTSKGELEKLTDKLTRNDLMGWINISKHGKDSKAIVLFFQRDYPELFGFFLPDTKILTSFVGNLASKQRSALLKLASGPDTHPFASESPSTSRSTRTRHKRKANEESSSTSGSTRTRPKRKAKKGVGARADNQSATNERKQTSPGLIPWWIFTGDLQK